MRHALAAAALLLVACDDLLSADLEIPSIQITLPSQEFPESNTGDPNYYCDPQAPQSSPPCIAIDLDYDLAGNVPILDDPNVTYDLRLTDVALTLSATQTVTGDKDLSDVYQVTIRVLEDPAIPGAGAVLATYTRPPQAGPVASFAVSGNSNLSLGPYVQAGRLPVRVELIMDGANPTPAFTADVRAGFSLQVNVDYDAFM